MDSFESKYGIHQEIAAALRRAQPTIDKPAVARSHSIKLLAIVCLGTSVMVDQTSLLIATFSAGAIGLLLSFRRDDTTSELTVDAFYDSQTGLPLATALPHVLDDEVTMRTLTGRLAIMAIDVPVAARLSAEGNRSASDAVLATISHRLQSHVWSEAADGAFGSLTFLQRPGTFLIVRRDVLDDRTTRWLAEKLIGVVNEPISWEGATIDPCAVLGAAVGTASQLATLSALAGEARSQARGERPGTVVILHRDRPAPSPPAEASLVAVADGARVGRFFRRTDAGSGLGMFEDFSGLMRVLDRALAATQVAPVVCFVGASATSLSHPDATAALIARINAADANGLIGLVLPSDFPTDADHRAVRTATTLHDCGLAVYVDRGQPAHITRHLPACPIDGIIVATEADVVAATGPTHLPFADAIKLGAVLVRSIPVGPAPQSHTRAPRVGRVDPSTAAKSGTSETDRLIREGQPTQLATGRSLTLR